MAREEANDSQRSSESKPFHELCVYICKCIYIIIISVSMLISQTAAPSASHILAATRVTPEAAAILGQPVGHSPAVLFLIKAISLLKKISFLLSFIKSFTR